MTIGVFGIITDNRDRVLLCHRRDHDLWNLPGGRVEVGEVPWDALVREIREETGLTAKPVRLIGVYSKPEKNEIVFSFACQVTDGTPTLTDEADSIEYFAVDDIPPNTPAKQVERIRDSFTQSTTTITRVQTGPSSLDTLREQ